MPAGEGKGHPLEERLELAAAIDALMAEPIAPPYRPEPLPGVWPARFADHKEPGGE